MFADMPVIEADRAEIVTESYRETEDEPIIMRRAKAFKAICEKLPIVIRPLELIVGSNAIAPRGCQMFPEYSYAWMEEEYDTVATREADKESDPTRKAELRTIAANCAKIPAKPAESFYHQGSPVGAYRYRTSGILQ